MSTQPESPSHKKRPPLYWLGSFLSILGGGLAGAFIARQFLEAGTGHTYYEFIGGGAVLAVIGIVIVWNLRRKNQ